MRTPKLLVLSLALTGALAALGCNGDSNGDDPTDSGGTPTNTEAETTPDTNSDDPEGTGSQSNEDTNNDTDTVQGSDTPEETDSCDALLAAEPPPAWDDNEIENVLSWYLPAPGDTDSQTNTDETQTDTDTGTAEDTDTGSASGEDTDTGSATAEDTDTGSATGEDTDIGSASVEDTSTDSATEEPLEGGLAGWNILSADYPKNNNLDLLSFEWDYFMIHDKDGRFTGSIGYLIANPRNSSLAIAPQLSELVPAGGNVAVAGKFEGGVLAANYQNFDDNYEASGTRRYFSGDDPESDIFAALVADPSQDALLLQGQTADFSWDLVITQEWPELTAVAGDDAFEAITDNKVGNLNIGTFVNEQWNVNMLWPRTKVVGTITDLSDPLNPVVTPIDGHGYRENSWGRWAFNSGGWDFAVVSDEETNVMWAWQTYHHKSTKLDYVDVAFHDGEELVIAHFDGNKQEVGWQHDTWSFDAGARQCMPQTTEVLAVNDDYIVEATLDIGANQVPMLSDATSATRSYVIEIQFPMVSGTIKRRSNGETIATFAGQGGGEFSNSRQPESVTDRSDDWCYCWGYDKFSLPMPAQ